VCLRRVLSESATEDGAFMEPSRRNRLQAAATPPVAADCRCCRREDGSNRPIGNRRQPQHRFGRMVRRGSPHHGAKFLRRVRNRKITLVTIPNSHPRIAVTRMIQTSDWRVDPNTQLTLTVRVLAATRAIMDHEQRDERARPGIEPGTAGMAKDAVSPRLPRRSFLRPTLLVHAGRKFSRSESGRNPAEAC